MSILPDRLPPIEVSMDSFVLRFVRVASDRPATSAEWHGTIRHVQTNRERSFVRWSDAVAFINDFVSIQEEEADSGAGG